jgi:hypothetical protein
MQIDPAPRDFDAFSWTADRGYFAGKRSDIGLPHSVSDLPGNRESAYIFRKQKKIREQTTMASIGRRGFVKGATLGALAVTVAGAEVFMAAGEARARGVPFRLLDAHQGETLEALGETLVPQAREAGIAHFIDQQLSVPPHEALLQARIFNFRPPFAEFYRIAITAVDEGSHKVFGRDFAQLSAADQRELVDRMRQNKIEGWTGPPGATIYAVLRADAVDVVYGTMEGYEALGIPYMPHIPPEKRW